MSRKQQDVDVNYLTVKSAKVAGKGVKYIAVKSKPAVSATIKKLRKVM